MGPAPTLERDVIMQWPEISNNDEPGGSSCGGRQWLSPSLYDL